MVSRGKCLKGCLVAALGNVSMSTHSVTLATLYRHVTIHNMIMLIEQVRNMTRKRSDGSIRVEDLVADPAHLRCNEMPRRDHVVAASSFKQLSGHAVVHS